MVRLPWALLLLALQPLLSGVVPPLEALMSLLVGVPPLSMLRQLPSLSLLLLLLLPPLQLAAL